jgi:hypothetical protein
MTDRGSRQPEIARGLRKAAPPCNGFKGLKSAEWWNSLHEGKPYKFQLVRRNMKLIHVLLLHYHADF